MLGGGAVCGGMNCGGGTRKGGGAWGAYVVGWAPGGIGITGWGPGMGAAAGGTGAVWSYGPGAYPKDQQNVFY